MALRRGVPPCTVPRSSAGAESCLGCMCGHIRSSVGAPELRRAAHERCSLAVALFALQLREAAVQSKGWLDGRRSNARVANKALKTLLGASGK